jgi:ABC-type ATPase involved in cell division
VLVATHDRELIKWVGRRTIRLEHGQVVPSAGMDRDAEGTRA